jgi:predicted phosphodiesterase
MDFGAPGQLVLNPKTPLASTFGATIKVENIWPDSTIDSFISGDANALTGDNIGELISYFTDESGKLVHELIMNILYRALIIFAGGMLLIILIYFAVKKFRWNKKRVFKAFAYGLSVCIILSATLTGLTIVDGHQKETAQSEPPSSSFSIDTGIGSLTFNGVISLPAKKINDVVVDTDKRGVEFYKKAVAAVPAALSDSAYKQASDEVLLMHITDIHDNVYMYPVVAAIAKEAGVSVLLDSGDVTKTGSSLEATFVNRYVKSMLKAGVEEIYYIRGNHDTKTTDKQMAAAGATVLNGIETTKDGLVVAGWGDPMHTELATSIHTAERTELLKEQKEQIKEDLTKYQEKNDSWVNFLLTHSPGTGKPSTEAGLADIQLSGHNHITKPLITTFATPVDLDSVSDTVEFDIDGRPHLTYLIEGNNTNGEVTAGQNEMFGTGVGPIRRNVVISLIKWNKSNYEYTYYTVTITPGGKVSASEILPLPTFKEINEPLEEIPVVDTE